MKKTIFVLIACISVICVTAQTKTTSSDHARQLLEVTGSANLGMQVINNMIESFRKELPDVPPEFWDELATEISPKELVDLMVPIYIKYYTDEELIQLVEFYKSPLGKKVVQKLPLIAQESYVVGEDWGRKLGEKVVNRLKVKGYIKSN